MPVTSCCSCIYQKQSTTLITCSIQGESQQIWTLRTMSDKNTFARSTTPHFITKTEKKEINVETAFNAQCGTPNSQACLGDYKYCLLKHCFVSNAMMAKLRQTSSWNIVLLRLWWERWCRITADRNYPLCKYCPLPALGSKRWCRLTADRN